MRYPTWIRQHLAALRALLVLTVLLGVAYPLAVFAVAQIPGLKHHADGSNVSLHGRTVGSALIGQSFTDSGGDPLKQYFQSRPSAAGDGYDPTSSGASNLGPEDVVDSADGPSLLSQVCARSDRLGGTVHAAFRHAVVVTFLCAGAQRVSSRCRVAPGITTTGSGFTADDRGQRRAG